MEQQNEFYIDFLEGGKAFQNRNAGTTTYYNEISEAEYNRITSIPDWEKTLRTWYKSHLSDAIIWGYGYYGCGIGKDDEGRCFFYRTIGNSCE